MRFLPAVLVLSLSFAATQAAGAATARGPGALAFSALVAVESPTLSTAQKQEMIRILDGVIPDTAVQSTLVVRANSIVCHESDVDLTSRGCSLLFGRSVVTLGGRAANELFGTMLNAGIARGGAAGTLYVRAKSLSCTVDFQQLRMRDGSGVNCGYQ